MPSRRPRAPDPDEGPKHLTLEDIAVGIRKFQRRIEEVKALDPQKMRYDDPRVEAATRNIYGDLIDVFGRHSPELGAHGAHWSAPRSSAHREELRVSCSARYSVGLRMPSAECGARVL